MVEDDGINVLFPSCVLFHNNSNFFKTFYRRNCYRNHLVLFLATGLGYPQISKNHVCEIIGVASTRFVKVKRSTKRVSTIECDDSICRRTNTGTSIDKSSITCLVTFYARFCVSQICASHTRNRFIRGTTN